MSTVNVPPNLRVHNTAGSLVSTYRNYAVTAGSTGRGVQASRILGEDQAASQDVSDCENEAAAWIASIPREGPTPETPEIAKNIWRTASLMRTVCIRLIFCMLCRANRAGVAVLPPPPRASLHPPQCSSSGHYYWGGAAGRVHGVLSDHATPCGQCSRPSTSRSRYEHCSICAKHSRPSNCTSCIHLHHAWSREGCRCYAECEHRDQARLQEANN